MPEDNHREQVDREEVDNKVVGDILDKGYSLPALGRMADKALAYLVAPDMGLVHLELEHKDLWLVVLLKIELCNYYK